MNMPIENIALIASRLSLFDAISYCHTNTQTREACKQDLFWSIFAKSRNISASSKNEFILEYFGNPFTDTRNKGYLSDEDVAVTPSVYLKIVKLMMLREAESTEKMNLFRTTGDPRYINARTYEGAFLVYQTLHRSRRHHALANVIGITFIVMTDIRDDQEFVEYVDLTEISMQQLVDGMRSCHDYFTRIETVHSSANL